MYDALRKDETTVGAIETQGHRIQGMWYKQQNNPQAQAALFRNMSIN
jgi:hypothetical protein